MPWILAGDLAEIAVALIAFLILEIVVYLIRGIAVVLPGASLITLGISLRGAFLAAAQPVDDYLTGIAIGRLQAVQNWINGIAYLSVELFDGVKSVADTISGDVAHLYNQVIPNAATHAQGSATSYTAQEITTLQREIATARTDFGKLAAADSAAEYAKAERSIATVHHELVAIAASGVTTAERYADTQVASLRATVKHDLAAAKLYTDQQLRDLAPPIPGAQGRTGAQGAQGVAGAAGAAAGAIAIPTGAAIPSGLTVQDITTGAIAGVGTAVAVIAAEIESCMVRTCAGNNNLQNLLGDILGLASLAEIGAFLAEIISDPAAAEAKYAGVFSAAVQPLVTGGGDVWTAIESVIGI